MIPAVTRGPKDLLRGQRHIPEQLRQSVVLIEFRKPIPRWKVSEFLRIHLQRMQLERGEQSAFMAEVFQPHRVGPKPCPKCNGVGRLDQYRHVACGCCFACGGSGTLR